VDGLWATKGEGVALIVLQLVSQISNLCGSDPPTLQTDIQMDDMQKRLGDDLFFQQVQMYKKRRSKSSEAG